MLRHLTFLLLTYACLVVQTGSGEALAWGDWKTHLVAAPVAASVLLFEGPAAILWAAVVGLWWDGLTGGPLGESLMLMAGIAKLLQWSLGGQPARSSAAIGLLVGATAWLHGLGWRVLEAWRDAPAISAAEILRLASQQALWTGLLTAAVLFGWRFLVRGLALRGRPLAPLVQNKWRMLSD